MSKVMLFQSLEFVVLRKILLHLIAIWVFVSSNAHADLSQIQALLDENKAEQAYKIASSLLDEYEGVTEFRR